MTKKEGLLETPPPIFLEVCRYLPLVELPRLFTACSKINEILNSELSLKFWASWLTTSSLRYTVVAKPPISRAVATKQACYRLLQTKYSHQLRFLASQRTTVRNVNAEVGRLRIHTAAVLLEKCCTVVVLPALILSLYLCVFSDSRHWEHVFPPDMPPQLSLGGEEPGSMPGLSPFGLHGVPDKGVISSLISAILCVVCGLWYLSTRSQVWHPSDQILTLYRSELAASRLSLHLLFLSSPFLCVLFLTPLIAFLDAAVSKLLVLFPWHTLPPPQFHNVLLLVYAMVMYLWLRVIFQRSKKGFLLWELFYVRLSLMNLAGALILLLVNVYLLQFIVYFGSFTQRVCAHFALQGYYYPDVAFYLARHQNLNITLENSDLVHTFSPFLCSLQCLCVYGVGVVLCVSKRCYVSLQNCRGGLLQTSQQTQELINDMCHTVGIGW